MVTKSNPYKEFEFSIISDNSTINSQLCFINSNLLIICLPRHNFVCPCDCNNYPINSFDGLKSHLSRQHNLSSPIIACSLCGYLSKNIRLHSQHFTVCSASYNILKPDELTARLIHITGNKELIILPSPIMIKSMRNKLGLVSDKENELISNSLNESLIISNNDTNSLKQNFNSRDPSNHIMSVGTSTPSQIPIKVTKNNSPIAKFISDIRKSSDTNSSNFPTLIPHSSHYTTPKTSRSPSLSNSPDNIIWDSNTPDQFLPINFEEKPTSSPSTPKNTPSNTTHPQFSIEFLSKLFNTYKITKNNKIFT